MQDQLYVIILNWNGWQDTLRCIQSVMLETKEIKYTICLVDNGSSDDEIREIETYLTENFQYILSGDKEYFLSMKITLSSDFIEADSYKKVLFIKNNENLGFAKGNNVALEVLKANKQFSVILLNNDTELKNDALSMMYLQLDREKVGAVIPQIRYYEPENIIWNCGGRINLFGVRKYYHAFSDISSISEIRGTRKVDFGTGCALMFNMNKVGALTEKYFFGEEDFEFSFRLKRLNLDIICLYDAVILHKVGSSRNQISENDVGKMVYHYCQRISNLKDNLAFPIWSVSVFLHFLSSLKQLYKFRRMNLNTIYRCWREILTSTTKSQFTLHDFRTISNKKY